MKDKQVELPLYSWRSIVKGDRTSRIAFQETITGTTTILHLEVLRSDAMDNAGQMILLIMGRVNGMDSFFHGCITQKSKEEYSLCITTELEEDALNLFQKFPNSSLEIFRFLRGYYVKEATSVAN